MRRNLLNASSGDIATAADRTPEDAYLAGYVASILERDLGWAPGSFEVEAHNGFVTVVLHVEDEDRREDEEAQLYGTTDVGHAIEEGTAWNPPEAPTPEGYPGAEERGEFGEDH